MLVGYPAGQSQRSNGLIFRPPVHPLVAATLQGYHPRRPLDLVDQNQSVAIRPDARLQTIDLGSISRNGPHTMNKPPARFELTTCCLQNSRTTAVLRWRNTIASPGLEPAPRRLRGVCGLLKPKTYFLSNHNQACHRPR